MFDAFCIFIHFSAPIFSGWIFRMADCLSHAYYLFSPFAVLLDLKNYDILSMKTIAFLFIWLYNYKNLMKLNFYFLKIMKKD